MPGELRLDGTVGRDPNIKFLDSGKPVCNFSVGVDEFKRDGTQWVKSGVTWFDVSVWDEHGQAVAEVLKKGDRVIVSGSVKASSYEKDGKTVPKIEVSARTVSVVPRPLKNPKQNESGEPW